MMEFWNYFCAAASFIPVAGNLAATIHGGITHNWVEMGLGIGFAFVDASAAGAYLMRHAPVAPEGRRLLADAQQQYLMRPLNAGYVNPNLMLYNIAAIKGVGSRYAQVVALK